MADALLAEIQERLPRLGPAQTIQFLCDKLREQHDYSNLFYALLMKQRHEMGVSPIPTGPSQDLPTSAHAAYEEGIRAAALEVGKLFLADNRIGEAWLYYRMLGEPGPVAQALETFQPDEGEDIQPLVQIAFYENVAPKRGFDLLLSRYGLCNAITTMSGAGELPLSTDARSYCVGRLAQTLHEELRERLRSDIERREGQAPPSTATIPQLLQGREKSIFEDDFAHIDTSHLSSIVQLASQLQTKPELTLVRELCVYGQAMPARLQFVADPPFENQYRDYEVFYSVLLGEHVAEGLEHFRKKIEQADPDEVGTFPAEVYVNLLLKLDRTQEALQTARQHLANVDNRRLSCPSIAELCQKAKDYVTLAEVAAEQGDVVHYLAGLLAQQKK